MSNCRPDKLFFKTTHQAVTAAWTAAFLLTLISVAPKPAQAQTFSVVHNFTGGQDGANPRSALTLGPGGSLYGTTFAGGNGFGGVFELNPRGSGWLLNPLYSFTGGADGNEPYLSAVVIGANGSLYGVTELGGLGFGVVYNLRPSATACSTALCPWNETVLYSFMGGSDGDYPLGRVLFDQAGNIYGITNEGAPSGLGTVWKLAPSGGGWLKTTLLSFNDTDGALPNSGFISDTAGNLYGTTAEGGSHGVGTVYQLTSSGSGWTENLLYNFLNGQNDGGIVFARLIFDQSGNLYGASSHDGSEGGGVAFELIPSGGTWIFNTLGPFSGTGPLDRFTMDAAGNLYGTTVGGGTHRAGSVFELTNSNGTWTLHTIYSFSGGSDGDSPEGTVVLDDSGNLFGTTYLGGTDGKGVVFEITP